MGYFITSLKITLFNKLPQVVSVLFYRFINYRKYKSEDSENILIR